MSDMERMKDMALQLDRALDELRREAMNRAAYQQHNARLKAHIARFTLFQCEAEAISPQPEIVADGEWWYYGDNVYRPADMQMKFLEEAPTEKPGGPLLADGMWYWSPVWDEDVHLMEDA
jgi:hypothetical protein